MWLYVISNKGDLHGWYKIGFYGFVVFFYDLIILIK